MKVHLILIPIFLLLQACSTTQPAPYQKDKTPEERTEYNGAQGLLQKQKDTSYLINKALKDKCDNAKIDRAVAISQGDEKALAAAVKVIDSSCR